MDSNDYGNDIVELADTGFQKPCEHDFAHEKVVETGFFGRYRERVIIYCKKCGFKTYE